VCSLSGFKEPLSPGEYNRFCFDSCTNLIQVPSRLASTGRKLLRAQRELADTSSVLRREALRGKIVGAAAQFRVLAGRYAREEAPPKGQGALAAANFQNNKSAAAELTAIRCDISAVRASVEAMSQAQLAFNEELLSALVSFSFSSLFRPLTFW
jgi:hypothetical protein